MSSTSSKTYGYQLHGMPDQEQKYPQNVNLQSNLTQDNYNSNNNNNYNNNGQQYNKSNVQSRIQTKKNNINESGYQTNTFYRESANPRNTLQNQTPIDNQILPNTTQQQQQQYQQQQQQQQKPIQQQQQSQLLQSNAQQVIPEWYENQRIPTVTSINRLEISQNVSRNKLDISRDIALNSQIPFQQSQSQQPSPILNHHQTNHLNTNSPQKRIFNSNYNNTRSNGNEQQSSPYPINQDNKLVYSSSDNRLSNNNNNNNNKTSYHPIFSNQNLNSINNQNQPHFEADISNIQSSFIDNDQVKHTKKQFLSPLDYDNEEKVKRSNNINNSLYSPSKSAKNVTSKKIFGDYDNLNKSQSYLKNMEILNSPEKIKKSKIFNDPQDQSKQLNRSNINIDNQVQDKYAREKAIKEQELRKLTLEQVFCQTCFELIHYETSDVIDRHMQNCKSLEESARELTNDLIQKERNHHNSFIEEIDHQYLENQQLIQIINTKLEKLRYLFMKMTNVLDESDFLSVKPEIKVNNLFEIKKSIEKILQQDTDYRFVLSCLNNIETQFKDIDLIQQVYCTPESTQFLQIIRTIIEIIHKKLELLSKITFY